MDLRDSSGDEDPTIANDTRNVSSNGRHPASLHRPTGQLLDAQRQTQQQHSVPGMADHASLFKVDGQQLKSKLCSKRDIMHMLAIEGQYHLPSADDITMPWLKEILAGRKRLIRNQDLCTVILPRIAEFSCDRYKQ